MSAIPRTETSQAPASVNVVGTVISSSLTGALAGHLFSIIAPAGGAIFGVTSALTSIIVDKSLDALGYRNSPNVIAKIVRTAIPIIIGAGVAGLITSACGFPITFLASLMLAGAIALTSMLIIGVIATCCLGSICLLGATAVPSRTL